MSALATHASITADLASNLRELGQVREAIARNRAEAWLQSDHLNVTERRETVAAHLAPLTAEAENLSAEIEALKVELAHAALVVQYGTGQE